MATLRQAIANIASIRRRLRESRDRIEQSVLFRQLGETQRRVFVEGKATDEGLITDKVSKNEVGVYGKRQGNKRKAGGRRVDLMDLNDQGTHSRSLIVGKEGKKNVIGFNTDKQRNIAAGHERYRKKRIYGPTKKEISNMNKVAIAELRAIIREAIR